MNDDKKDLINFDKHGRPRTPDEIADILGDSVIAFDENGRLRTAEQIAAIKWQRVTAKPEVKELLLEGLETYARVREAIIIEPTIIPSNISCVVQRLQEVRSQKEQAYTIVEEHAYR